MVRIHFALSSANTLRSAPPSLNPSTIENLVRKKQNKEWWMPAAMSPENTWWFPNKTGRTFFLPADARNQGAASEQVSAPTQDMIRFAFQLLNGSHDAAHVWAEIHCWMFILYEASSSVMWTMCDLCYRSSVDWWYIHPSGHLVCTYCCVWDYGLIGRLVTWWARLHGCSQSYSGRTV